VFGQKHLFVWAMCLLVLIFAVNGYGDTITWNNSTGDQDYANSQNWFPTKVPLPGDIVVIGSSSIPIDCSDSPVLDSGSHGAVDIYIGHIAPGQMIINGGSFTATGNVIIGAFGSLATGVLTINNGSLDNTGFGFIVGDQGRGRVDIFGGDVTANFLKLAYNGGSGIVNIKGGTLTVTDEFGMDIQYEPASLNNLINITEGTLIRAGNKLGEISYLIGLGYIAGYNGLGMLDVDYDSMNNITTVQASCPGCYSYDATDDFIVDISDLKLLASCWLDDDSDECFKANFNNDCAVNNSDFALLASQWTNQRWRFLYNPWWDYVNDVEGRAFSSTELIKKNMCRLGSFDDSFMSSPITWAVGDFSGFYPSGDLTISQRGQSGYGACAIQMQGTTVGFQLHTWSTPPENPNYYDLLNGSLVYNWWDSYPPYGWRYDTSSVKLKYLFKVPTVYWEGEGKSVPYAYAALVLKDRTTGIKIWFCIANYDPRGTSHEYIGWDPGTAMAMIVTLYGPGTSYCTLATFSEITQSDLWDSWKYFDCIITRQNLTNAMQDLNLTHALGVSTNPDDYTIYQLSLQTEIYWPDGNAHLGAAYKECYLTEEW